MTKLEKAKLIEFLLKWHPGDHAVRETTISTRCTTARIIRAEKEKFMRSIRRFQPRHLMDFVDKLMYPKKI